MTAQTPRVIRSSLVTFTSGNATETDDADNQSGNSFPFVYIQLLERQKQPPSKRGVCPTVCFVWVFFFVFHYYSIIVIVFLHFCIATIQKHEIKVLWKDGLKHSRSHSPRLAYRLSHSCSKLKCSYAWQQCRGYLTYSHLKSSRKPLNITWSDYTHSLKHTHT